MNLLQFTLLVWLGSLAAGFLGALTGLGGGVVIVPLLTLAFGVDIRYAIGAALVSVIGTSSGAAAAYVREGYVNVRLGIFLEVATTLGALAGATVATLVPGATLAIVFGGVLAGSAFLAVRSHPDPVESSAVDPLAARLRLNGSYPTLEGPRRYGVRRVPLGFVLMFGAGVLSGLLGIGAGAFKVLALDQVMRVPFKVSTTTSNFMIGVTAAASAGVYLSRGYLDPGLCMPVVLGVLPGAALGAWVLGAAHPRGLRLVFAVVLLAVAAQMIYRGLGGGL